MGNIWQEMSHIFGVCGSPIVFFSWSGCETPFSFFLPLPLHFSPTALIIFRNEILDQRCTFFLSIVKYISGVNIINQLIPTGLMGLWSAVAFWWESGFYKNNSRMCISYFVICVLLGGTRGSVTLLYCWSTVSIYHQFSWPNCCLCPTCSYPFNH